MPPESVSLQVASYKLRIGRYAPLDAISRFSSIDDFSDDLTQLRDLQLKFFGENISIANKSGDTYANPYSRQTLGDNRTSLGLDIDQIQQKLTQPLIRSLTYTLAALRNVRFPDGAMQIVESTMLKVEKNVGLIPNFDTPEKETELGLSIKLIVDDPNNIWFSIFPEALTDIKSRPWILLIDAFLACVELKTALEEPVNPSDIKAGVVKILELAGGEQLAMNSRVVSEINSLWFMKDNSLSSPAAA